MQKIKVHIIVGARPNFMKAAPVLHALDEAGAFETTLVHTGQHYDINMSDIFFTDLGMRTPDAHLEVGQGTQMEQLAKIGMAYEKFCADNKPDYMIVVGDVTSTLAASLAAQKMGILLCHLEAGLRSYDRTMPEELNRLITDQLSDILWTPSRDADENLIKENIAESRIELVGNVMIDTLIALQDKAEAAQCWAKQGLERGQYGLVTLHRPNNVDDADSLKAVIGNLREMAKECPLVFPVHPRTKKSLEAFGLLDEFQAIDGITDTGPLGYIDFMSLTLGAKFVYTDSGGIQEETTYLKIPCMTLRPNTERPITLTIGTNRLVNHTNTLDAFADIMAGNWQAGEVPPYWDGKTAKRVAACLMHHAGLAQDSEKKQQKRA